MTYLRLPRETCRCGAYPFPHRSTDKNCIAFREEEKADRREQSEKQFATPYQKAMYNYGLKEKDFK